MLAASRALAACVCAVVAVGVGGCTSAGTGVTATGTTLKIYASIPLQTGGTQAKDVLDAEKLALTQAGSQVGKFRLSLITLPADSAKQITANARRAIEDTSAIAYLGESMPGASASSVGITNAQDLLQLSPTDTALELTQSSAAVPSAPNKYYESLGTYGRTFARVVPSAALEAKAQVKEMRALHVSRLYIADDGTPYGAALALAVRNAAASTITVVNDLTSADGYFYGSGSVTGAAQKFDSVDPGTTAHVKLFGPSALDEQALVSALTSTGAQRNVYISSPGFLASDLTPGGQAFVQQFKLQYGRAPAIEAIFGFETMSALLAVLKEAGSSANSRSTVVKDFFAIRNRASVLGTYSIDTNGDTNLAPFVFNHISGAKLVPFTFLQAQG